MRWKNIYQVQIPGAAEGARLFLEQNGVPARLRGSMLLGGVGELPAEEAWPSVWVPESHAERAAALVRQYDDGAVPHGADWTCSGCGEEVEASFGSCWNCGTDAPVER